MSRYLKLFSIAGAVFGADDFLPCLTWVLLRSNLVSLQVDTDYMMELLDPTQLQGEGQTNTGRIFQTISSIIQKMCQEEKRNMYMLHLFKNVHVNDLIL